MHKYEQIHICWHDGPNFGSKSNGSPGNPGCSTPSIPRGHFGESWLGHVPLLPVHGDHLGAASGRPLWGEKDRIPRI